MKALSSGLVKGLCGYMYMYIYILLTELEPCFLIHCGLAGYYLLCLVVQVVQCQEKCVRLTTCAKCRAMSIEFRPPIIHEVVG